MASMLGTAARYGVPHACRPESIRCARRSDPPRRECDRSRSVLLSPSTREWLPGNYRFFASPCWEDSALPPLRNLNTANQHTASKQELKEGEFPQGFFLTHHSRIGGRALPLNPSF